MVFKLSDAEHFDFTIYGFLAKLSARLLFIQLLFHGLNEHLRKFMMMMMMRHLSEFEWKSVCIVFSLYAFIAWHLSNYFAISTKVAKNRPMREAYLQLI